MNHKKAPVSTEALKFGSATWTRTRDPMINSHLLYRLSYRGTTVRILLFAKEKSTLCAARNDAAPGG